MNEKQQKLVRTIKFILYPIPIILFLYQFFTPVSGNPASTIPGIDKLQHYAELLLIWLFFIVFSIVALAIIVQFIQQQLNSNKHREGISDIIFEIRKPYFFKVFLPLIFVMVLVVGMNYMLLHVEQFNFMFNLLTTRATAFTLFFYLFYVIAHFLFIGFTINAIRNQPFFVLTTHGFLYEPGGISPGLIYWTNINEMKEATVLRRNSRRGNSYLEPVLVISLKDSSKNTTSYNVVLRILVKWGTKLIQYQNEGVGDIVLNPFDFGNRYTEVKEKMQALVDINKNRIEGNYM
jgi:hypothetical protein